MIKKFVLTLILSIFLAITSVSHAKVFNYGATALTGGAAGALDAINGQNLVDGDRAHVVTSTGSYNYVLDSDSGLTESSPWVIGPDSNAGDKRWILLPLFTGVKDTTANSTSGTGEDTLSSTIIQAGVLGTSGGIRIIAAGTKTGGNGNKTLKLHFGGDSWTFHDAANNTEDWRVEAEIVNITASTQRVSLVGYGASSIVQDYDNASVSTSVAVTVKITGECADGGDTITQALWIVELI